MKQTNRTFTWKNRLKYWFDNRMSKGSLGFIRLLIAASVLLAILVAGLIILLNFNEEGETASVFWDSIATVINAWMPSFEDGSPGYVILMSVVAIAGVLFTSVLIGIVTSAIETKIENLKQGNSLVLEKGHTVILGFYPGEYTLLSELILAAAGSPACVVIAEDMDREEMEQNIAENVAAPKNFRIICRTADITDPASLEKCSVETCKTIIVSPADDMRTVKAVLAVSILLAEKGVPEISVNALVSNSAYIFPQSAAEANNITTLETNSILAKMIAHSCTQTGLSETFREVFNFEGSEFYLADIAGINGLTFEDLLLRTDNATPAGVLRGGEVTLNPPPGFVFNDTDRVLVFAEESDSAKLVSAADNSTVPAAADIRTTDDRTDTVIIGYNETLPVLLRELPENVSHVYLAGQSADGPEKEELERIAAGRGLHLDHIYEDPRSEEALCGIARMAEHIVILNDHEKDAEEADMEAIFLLMRLRDIRKRFDLSFNITVEMQRERNQKLAGRGDATDFLVTSSMSSLILARLAESPELRSVFREILSNKGNELYLKSVSQMRLQGRHTVRDLRRIMLQHGYLLIGHLDADKNSRFDLPLGEVITLKEEDCLIVLGDK